MRLLGQLLVDDFCVQHPDARAALDAWSREVRDAAWATPHDLRAAYARVSILGGRRAVFNIRGNRFRLDCRIDYERQIVLVVRLGTHAEYDGWTFDD